MDWFAEIWKWIDANLVNWFVMLWWFTALVFLLSAFGRWLVWRWFWDPEIESRRGVVGWAKLLALGTTASWWGDWRRLAARYATRGKEIEFVTTVLAAHTLPLYALLIIFAFGKEYLLVYLVAVVVFFVLVLVPARFVLAFPHSTNPDISSEQASSPPIWMAPVRELGGVAPRFFYGVLAAAILAAVAIHPDWVFPVEITGSGIISQLLNGIFGVVVAVGAWTPPVGAFLLGVPIWRGGFALAGLVAFLLAVPATPQAVMAYAEWIGANQATKLAALILVAAIIAGIAATAVVAAVELRLPYLYSPDQLLWMKAGSTAQ